MAVPTQIYNFLIEEIRKLDQQEGYRFVERYLIGPQTIWEINAEILQTIPNIWSITECPDRILQYLKNIVGWTSDLNYITNELDYDTLRRLISVSVSLWKNRGPEDTINNIIYFTFNSRNRIWNWFDFRWVLDETQLGEDHQGLDSWVIDLPNPEISGAENVSNLRVVEPESKIALEGILELMRAVNETIEITYLKFLDQFLIEGDLTQWQDPTTYNLTVEDGVLKVGDSGTGTTPELAWTEDTGTNWLAQVIYFRVRFFMNNSNMEFVLYPYETNMPGYSFGYSIFYTPYSGQLSVIRHMGSSFSMNLGTVTYDLDPNVWYGFRFEIAYSEGSRIIKVYIDANLVITAIDNSPLFVNGSPALQVSDGYIECSEIESMYTVENEEPFASFENMTYTNATSSYRHTIGPGGIGGGYYVVNEIPLRRILNRVCMSVESRITNLAQFNETLGSYLKTEATDTIVSNQTGTPLEPWNDKADEFIPSSTSAQHLLYRTDPSLISGKEYNLSVYVKKNGWRYAYLGLPASHFVGTPYARFDLNTGERLYGSVPYLIKPVQDDWISIAISGICDTTDTGVPFYFGACVPSGVDFSGDGTSLYFWLPNLQEGYSSNQCGFMSSPNVATSSPVIRNEGRGYWAPGNYSHNIGSKKHSLIWAPHWGTDHNLPSIYSTIYDLYLSSSERITLMWNHSYKYVYILRNGTETLATTTPMTFGPQEAKIINLDPTNGTVEVLGATTGGSSNIIGSWKQYFTPLMTLFLGHNWSYNYATYLNGNISEIYPTE